MGQQRLRTPVLQYELEVVCGGLEKKIEHLPVPWSPHGVNLNTFIQKRFAL